MTIPAGGRPTLFTPELAATICDRVSSGKSLREICRADGMPDDRTVRRWALDDVQGFAAQFKRACELRAHALADEIIEISDDATNDWMDRQRADGSTERVPDHEHIQRSKLRTDNRRWLLSKVLPTVFGDRQVLAGDPAAPLHPVTALSDIDARIDELLAKRQAGSADNDE